MLPSSLKNLIDNFKNLPGIGNKTAERLAFSMIDFEKKNLTSFSDAILEISMLFEPTIKVGQLVEIKSLTWPDFDGQYKEK